MAAVPTAARRRSLAAAKAAAHVTHSPVDVRQEVCRLCEETGEKGVCLPTLDRLVALQRRPRLEVVVHPPPVLAEPVAVAHVRDDVVPAHPVGRSKKKGEKNGGSAHR